EPEQQVVLDQVAVPILRWFPTALLLSYWSGVWDADGMIMRSWEAFCRTEFSTRPMAEAYVAAGSFAIWIALFSLADSLPMLQRFRMTRFDRDSKPGHISLAVF
ncbi:unnamed protein product, partial [Polarella glacialis]